MDSLVTWGTKNLSLVIQTSADISVLPIMVYTFTTVHKLIYPQGDYFKVLNTHWMKCVTDLGQHTWFISCKWHFCVTR